MSRKKYISTGANPLSIDKMDKGVLRTFDFKGGLKHPVFKAPSYSTDKIEEQKLLEAHPSFNVSFKLEVTIDEPEPIPESKQEIGSEPEPEIKDMEFRNVQDAKTWLNKEHGIPFYKINNKTKVTKEALNIGINMLFELDNK